jgi:hypothetical protein
LHIRKSFVYFEFPFLGVIRPLLSIELCFLRVIIEPAGIAKGGDAGLLIKAMVKMMAK